MELDALCEMVMQLCLMVGINTLCTYLLPSGSMRGVLHLACGWMLLHMMLSNLLTWGGQYTPEQSLEGMGAWMTRQMGR